jgi:SAM-dependent methyltransferase
MTQPAVRADVWAAGAFYEPYVGRWSRLVAPEFVSWLGVKNGKEWVDVGCGTGALTQAILDGARPKSVLGIEPSAGYLDYAKAHARAPDLSFKLGSKPNISFRIADALSLPVLGESMDAAVSGLVLNFVDEPQRAVAEMVRVTRSGGTVGAYVWDYAGKMELLRTFWDAAVALDPPAGELDEGRRFSKCREAPLAQLLIVAGLEKVETRAIDVPLHFRDFDDYWTPFLGGQGPAPSYVASLDRERRELLRDTIRDDLPIRRDGSIRLKGRAWAVKGRVA